MDAISYTAARANLAKTMDRVTENHEAVIITRQTGQAVVMMSLEDFNAWQETTYLMRGPANAKRLIESVEQARAGGAKPRKLLPDE